jgi:hypothetical protein
MKNYDKLLKKVRKLKEFSVVKSQKRTTIKVIHNKSNQLYCSHPSEKAYYPLKRWINQFLTNKI